MTNNVSSVTNNINTNTYDNKVSTAAAQAFSSILQTKMNRSSASIANFDNIDGNKNNGLSNSLFSNAYGTNESSGAISDYDNSTGLGGLLGGAGGNIGSSGIDNQTLVAFMFLMLASSSGEGSGSQAMLSSFTSALGGGRSAYSSVTGKNPNLGFSGTSLMGSAYKMTPVSPGSGSYPSSMGKKCSPAVVNNVGNRSAQAYRNVYEQFNVEKNPRYTPYKNGSTYCNIYVWDVTTAMGAQIPHRVDANGDIAKDGASGVKYMTANAMYDWLGGKGKEYGWKEVSAQEAQRYANMGSPAVTSWKNPKGHGHIQMVVPSGNGGYNADKGVAISQAGSKVIENGYITDVFKGSKLKEIKYFVHA